MMEKHQQLEERHTYTCTLLEELIRLEQDAIVELTLLTEQWRARYEPLLKKAQERLQDWQQQLEQERSNLLRARHEVRRS